jgi:hypothetical protein
MPGRDCRWSAALHLEMALLAAAIHRLGEGSQTDACPALGPRRHVLQLLRGRGIVVPVAVHLHLHGLREFGNVLFVGQHRVRPIECHLASQV